MIGDVSQLPPIEWGRPFFDLFLTKKIPPLKDKKFFFIENGNLTRSSSKNNL